MVGFPPESEPQDIRAYAKQAKAHNTHRAYDADWRDFEKYLKKLGRSALPASPDDVARYLRNLIERRRLKIATVTRRLAAIADKHKGNGCDSPCDDWVVKNTLRRLRAEYGHPSHGKAPLVTKDLKRLLGVVPPTLVGARDRAILLLGFAGAMRRSDIVNLDFQDLALAPEGLVVSIKKGKTDQARKGRKIGIPYGTNESTCPVRAVIHWLELTGIVDGPLFRGITKHGALRTERLSNQVVAIIVKQYLKVLGESATRFSAHSLRAGFITAAAVAGVPDRIIQDQSGHKSIMTLRRYIRDACIFRTNAASKVGL